MRTLFSHLLRMAAGMSGRSDLVEELIFGERPAFALNSDETMLGLVDGVKARVYLLPPDGSYAKKQLQRVLSTPM